MISLGVNVSGRGPAAASTPVAGDGCRRQGMVVGFTAPEDALSAATSGMPTQRALMSRHDRRLRLTGMSRWHRVGTVRPPRATDVPGDITQKENPR
jgi:hypothetical protein